MSDRDLEIWYRTLILLSYREYDGTAYPAELEVLADGMKALGVKDLSRETLAEYRSKGPLQAGEN